MRKWKWILTIVCVLLLVVSLNGCDTVSVPTDPTTTGKPGTLQTGPSQPTTESVPKETRPSFDYPPAAYVSELTIPESGLNANVQYLPETVENPENLPVLKWLCIATEKQTWTEAAVHELNRMLADRDMPYRVQFVMLTGDVSLYAEWFSQPEAQELLQDADLIWAYMTPENQQEYLMPITGYVTGDAQPTLKNTVIHELHWTSSTVDGEIYGILTHPLGVGNHGWSMKPEVLTKYGLTEADFNRNYWEMDEIFGKIYAANENRPFLYFKGDGYTRKVSVSGITTTIPLLEQIDYTQQNIGLTFGIVISSGTPEVVNMLETDTTRLIHEAIIRYKDAGYITTDAQNAEIFYQYSNANQTHHAFGRIYFPVTDTIFNNQYGSTPVNGIVAGSQHKEAAVSLLNLIAEDAEFRHQLLFGKEGRDYTLADGNYSVIKREDGAYYNMEFLSMYYAFDSVREKDDWPISYEGKSKLQTYLECMDSVSFCYYPLTFDYSGLEAELEEYARIFGDYSAYLTNNIATDPEGKYKIVTQRIDGVVHEKRVPRMDREAYDEMLQKLNEAGARKIIAELQRQLDEWLAKNPDWQ